MLCRLKFAKIILNLSDHTEAHMMSVSFIALLQSCTHKELLTLQSKACVPSLLLQSPLSQMLLTASVINEGVLLM